ncbi:MAG: hypothetical protein DPW18_17095 [Chloroflexi bacterium]|nr:hypothetical protein [Chloroflexota bacterium]MDL1941692.1 hypothetical protein [Chloroflexi bacterium CFX2]
MSQLPIIPIYTTGGDTGAFLQYPYLYNRSGEWIGFVTPNRDVYSVLGEYVGRLTDDPRIVAKRATSTLKPRLQPPPEPGRIAPPATVPLPRLMADLSHSLIDILMDAPERLHTVDAGDLREDMD